MNIGIVTTWYECGAAYVSKQFKDALEKDNIVFIYARGRGCYLHKSKNWKEKCVWWGKPITCPFRSTAIDKRDFIKWIKINRIEIVLFNEQTWLEPVIWCRNLKIKTIAYIDYYKRNTIESFALYDGLICNTKRHYEVFKWHPGAKYIPWGTNIEIFKPKNSSIIKETVSPGLITFFHSAGMNPFRKGTDLLIKAFYNINKSNSKLIIHTQVQLQKYFPKLKNKINEMQDNGKLMVITKTVHAPGLYSMGDVYVYPSRLDGIGLTVAEAMASGLACIVTNNAPMNEFVEKDYGQLIDVEKFYSREDGYYWPQSDCSIESIEASMLRYIENFDELLRHKKLTLFTAKKNRNWNVNALNFTDLIKQMKNSMHSDNHTKKVIEALSCIQTNKKERLVTALIEFDPILKYIPFLYS